MSGRRKARPFISAGMGMWVALALLAQTVAGMAFGVLPLTVLIDAVLEFAFVCWWVVSMFARVDHSTILPNQPAPEPGV